MAEYSFESTGAINTDALDQTLKTENPAVTGISTSPGIVLVFTNADLNQTEIDALAAIVAAHNPAVLSIRQAGIAQLVAFLDNHLDDLKYGDYFYRLFIRLVHADLWADKPNLTNTTSIIVTALRGGKATTAEMTDVNHIQMYNVFLWHVQRTAGIVLVSGDLPPAPTAAQAQAINQAAYVFAQAGTTMMNMILLNQRL